MNNRPFLFLIINLFLLTISISCSKLEREKDMLELYTTSLLINQEGGEECIDLMANGLWEIQDIPDWISASPTSGDGYGMVTIKVAENKGAERRKASSAVFPWKSNGDVGGGTIEPGRSRSFY